MRRYMKYVAAGLFVAALLVVLFLPLLDISAHAGDEFRIVFDQ